MPDGRPAIPQELKRRVLVEAGHRCAIPTCLATPVEIAHIRPWAQVYKHQFENLIALCPTCHTRFDTGEIDRLSMLRYKKALTDHRALDRAVKSSRLAAYVDFVRATNEWSSLIQRIEIHDVSTDDDEGREELVARCSAAAGSVGTALMWFRQIYDAEVMRLAEDVYYWMKSWADDVVDGLWPSTHPGATPHDSFEFAEELSNLMLAVLDDVGVTEDELSGLTFGATPRLGGTGKRF